MKEGILSSCLITVILVTTSSAFLLPNSHLSRTKTHLSMSVENRKKKVNRKKKNFPEAEIINRRKSPALWREDLTTSEESIPSTSDSERRRDKLSFPRRPPEVMAPCGGFPQLKAAISNGADSVYLGLTSFSARARASNFDPHTGELSKAVSIAHESGVRVYVALNTLVFQTELEEVAELIYLCDEAGVDAVIVQDLGVTKLMQNMDLNLEIHASTQQTVTNGDGVFYAKERGGATRVVLGRELSLKEIQSVTNEVYASTSGEEDDVEVEAFVHGALCVSYSGQCFSSEAWGGRSANRGQCAQACRLPYGLIQNGELVDLQDMSYLLSPQDQSGLDHVEDLVRAGVSCLKIEGRLKDERYVAATTRAYRNAVDSAWEKIQKERLLEGTDDTSFMSSRVLASEETVSKEELVQIFSRGQDEDYDGLSPGFFDGVAHQSLVRGRSPRHRGIHVGRIVDGSNWKNGLIIRTDNNDQPKLKRGDGIVVDRGMPQEKELGGPIFDIQELDDRTVLVKLGNGVEKEWKKLDEASRRGFGTQTPLAPVDAHLWKTSDATVDKKMRRLTEATLPKVGVHVSVTGKIDDVITVTITDLSSGHTGIGQSEGVLVAAETKGLELKSIKKAIGTLGNTKWSLQGDIDTSELDQATWCPISWVKKARQRAVEDLTRNSAEKGGITRHSENEYNDEYNEIIDKMLEESHQGESQVSSPQVSVLCRNLHQINALCKMAKEGTVVDEVIVDFLEVDGMREAISMAHEASLRVVVASPRIIKPGENGIWKTLLRLEADGLLIRSAGLIRRLEKLGGEGASVDVGLDHPVQIPELLGDFSLNAVNSLTAKEILDYGGISRITAAYDLSAASITELAKAMGAGAEKFEVVAHTHIPIFHTEHCVFARFLSKGDSFLDCGHVCTRNNIHLRDQSGNDNLVLADMGCRNTVFSAEAQSGVHTLLEWADAGIGWIRIELVDENNEDVEKMVKGYLNVLSGEQRASDVWEMLKTIRDSNGRTAGVSHGSLRNNSERRAGEL